jgi:hypothetical protein
MIDRLMAENPESLEDMDEMGLREGISDAREWFEEDCDAPKAPVDILDIIQTCLQAVKKIRTPRAFKAFVRLTAVLQYVKLWDRYRNNPRCKKPSLNASLAIARQVGKDQYHARQIRANEKYLVQHGRLPPNKKEQSHGQYTLLDNQSILLGVQKYLAAQGLGKITPHELVGMSMKSYVLHWVLLATMRQYQNALPSTGSINWDTRIQRSERACISMATSGLMSLRLGLDFWKK